MAPDERRFRSDRIAWLGQTGQYLATHHCVDFAHRPYPARPSHPRRKIPELDEFACADEKRSQVLPLSGKRDAVGTEEIEATGNIT